jgi:lipopolysaccharide/colanic/teichoic acid biosynthesis glycosyltransferase
MKRGFDLIASIAGLLLLAPLMAFIALVIRVTMGRPILFRQARPGRHGETFTMYKFRSMRDDRDAQEAVRPDAQRLTTLGRLLRHTSLDELPELWNVMRGEMSLVGPRPLLTEYLPLYNREQARRHEVRPGITGWAQVNGRNAISWEDKFALDVWYVDHRSLALDFKILATTFKRVLRSEGVAQEGHATAESFRGSRV